MGIELVNLKGNITLGGELNGQVELNNTITDEIRDMIANGKHIETITNDNPKERMIVDIWALAPGVYYFGGEGNGFYGDLTHGTNTEDTTQRIILASGGILVLGGEYTAEIIEKEADYLMGNIKRSYIAIGTTNNSVDRFYTGTLAWSSVNGFSGTVNLVENSGNRVSTIDDKIRSVNYPTAKAVKDYVDAAIAGIEIPEASGGGFTELDSSEDRYIYDYDSGIYYFDGLDNGTYFWMSDECYVGLIKGIAIIIQADSELYEWIYIGLDATYFSCSTKGTTYFDSDGECWLVEPQGEIEQKHNKISNIRDGYINNEYYPSTQGLALYVKKQFEEKLIPIDIDVGSEHGDNEFYNANAVDAVLIEVVGLLEEMYEYIEEFARGLDDHEARLAALEGN